MGLYFYGSLSIAEGVSSLMLIAKITDRSTGLIGHNPRGGFIITKAIFLNYGRVVLLYFVAGAGLG